MSKLLPLLKMKKGNNLSQSKDTAAIEEKIWKKVVKKLGKFKNLVSISNLI